MNDRLRTIFLLEARRQADYGLMAARDLERALSVDDERCWYSMQSLLVAAGNVSKILWPMRIGRRGKLLRKELGVPDSSPLRPRRFKNHFEHFDTRLERWAKSSRHRNFADANIGPPGMIGGLATGDYLRNYDPNSQTLTFRGDDDPLEPIIEALRELLHGRS